MKSGKWKVVFNNFQFFVLLFLSITSIAPAYAYQECIITTDKKLSDIKIEHNDVIDVFPLVTIMNDKNTLVVHPLKEGTSRFIVTKGGKEKFVFNVTITRFETKINEVDGFDIFQIDTPPQNYEYELDTPPTEPQISEEKRS